MRLIKKVVRIAMGTIGPSAIREPEPKICLLSLFLILMRTVQARSIPRVAGVYLLALKKRPCRDATSFSTLNWHTYMTLDRNIFTALLKSIRDAFAIFHRSVW